MEVPRDVVLDLLPIYPAGEASAETEALVKGCLERDPDLARLAREWQGRLPGPPPAPSRPDAQTLAYREAKRRMAVIIAVVAGVIAAGALALGALIFLFFFHASP